MPCRCCRIVFPVAGGGVQRRGEVFVEVLGVVVGEYAGESAGGAADIFPGGDECLVALLWRKQNAEATADMSNNTATVR